MGKYPPSITTNITLKSNNTAWVNGTSPCCLQARFTRFVLVGFISLPMVSPRTHVRSLFPYSDRHTSPARVELTRHREMSRCSLRVHAVLFFSESAITYAHSRWTECGESIAQSASKQIIGRPLQRREDLLTITPHVAGMFRSSLRRFEPALLHVTCCV